MYTVRPKGLNIKQSDRDVSDGFLQESINLQWRNGAKRPIPNRLSSGIPNVSDKKGIILHKVSDEDKINVLMFNIVGTLYWQGVFEDGVYSELSSPVVIVGFPTVTDFDSLSFTILNGLIYFMSTSQKFYYRLQFNETDEEYEVKDMYAWKDLNAFYPEHRNVQCTWNGVVGYNKGATCGYINIRYTLLLKTGEEVMHSPIYPFTFVGYNNDDITQVEGDLVTNIHTMINVNFNFEDDIAFNENISSIKVYATVPRYRTEYKTDWNSSSSQSGDLLYSSSEQKSLIKEMAEEPFYLLTEIDSPSELITDKAIMIFVGDPISEDLSFNDVYEYIEIDASTIAAGAIMPVDNFSHHKLFGSITSNNGRILITDILTILSNGYSRSLSLLDNSSRSGYYFDSEDGIVNSSGYVNDKAPISSSGLIYYKAIISYPDNRATRFGSGSDISSDIIFYKTSANESHNMACALDFYLLGTGGITYDQLNSFEIDYSCRILYLESNSDITISTTNHIDGYYSSNNRFQFSEIGEFSLWPAVNSYRVGEGRVLFTGVNSVDPANMDYIAPLIIGTSDGVYTVNFDVTGTNLVQSITQTAKMPAISDKNIQIDQNLIYVSDKGLIAINSGRLVNLTEDYFPDQGDGGFSINDEVYPNYNELTNIFFHGDNPYVLDDIINYMKEAIFAYDGRRNNLWCSNPRENFSLIFNLTNKEWDMSSYVFESSIGLFSLINTDEGEIYSRYLIVDKLGNVDVLSGENMDLEIDVHMLTRSIKMQTPNDFKKIERLISRCEFNRSSQSGYFSFGLWGKQDINNKKSAIPIIAIKDDVNYVDGIRQDIPIGRQKGKYRTITILQCGKCTPDSSIDTFDIVAITVNNNIIR